MTKPIVNEAHKAALDALLLPVPGVVAGKIFGFPAYYINRKLFACVYGDGVGLKVQEQSARSLLAKDHMARFQPMGKARVRERIQINRANPADYPLDLEIFQAAIRYVGALSGSNQKRPSAKHCRL